MKRNYYRVLGVSKKASIGEIRSAYRQRALELHPDVSGFDSGPFIELREAYEVLADPTRRRAYDEESRKTSPLRSPKSAKRKRQAEPFGADGHACGASDDAFDEMAEASRAFDAFNRSFTEFVEEMWGGRELAGPDNLTVEVPLSRTQASAGGSVTITVPGSAACPTCQGYGRGAYYECLDCDGAGRIAVDFGVVVNFPPALRRGRVVRVPLDQCGLEHATLTVEFRVVSA